MKEKQKVRSELSEEFLMKVGEHRMLFVIVVDVFTEDARKGFTNKF